MELGSVQSKLSCLFEVAVLSEPSEKRSYQPYRVVATDRVRAEAIEHDVHNSLPSEKLDGTCVLISQFKGRPWLWARHDRKPNKQAEKKFRAFQRRTSSSGSGPVDDFVWDVKRDFKDVPEHWFPASGVQTINDCPQPDCNGHIPGWVPVDPKSRQHCWHLSAVQLDQGLALILREDDGGELEIVAIPLSDLEGHSAELIGTNINGNAYKIGTKQDPIHLLVVHGSVKLKNPPPIDLDKLRDWFSTSGTVEGIVWHCKDGTLFKLHRHHLGLTWPIPEPVLSKREVKLLVDLKSKMSEPVNGKQATKDLFWFLGNLYGQKCNSITKIHELLSIS